MRKSGRKGEEKERGGCDAITLQPINVNSKHVLFLFSLYRYVEPFVPSHFPNKYYVNLNVLVRDFLTSTFSGNVLWKFSTSP